MLVSSTRAGPHGPSADFRHMSLSIFWHSLAASSILSAAGTYPGWRAPVLDLGICDCPLLWLHYTEKA
eukprot:970136-Amphidinium_carterae.1